MRNLASEFERNVEHLKLHRMLYECWSSLGKTQKCIRTGFCLFCGMKKAGRREECRLLGLITKSPAINPFPPAV